MNINRALKEVKPTGGAVSGDRNSMCKGPEEHLGACVIAAKQPRARVVEGWVVSEGQIMLVSIRTFIHSEMGSDRRCLLIDFPINRLFQSSR